MADANFERTVFINCPFDDNYAPLLEAAIFCLVLFGFKPRLANERLEAGENRLEKIVGMLRSAKYSIHDLSNCKSTSPNEYFRMNMPFEYGLDVGFRRGGDKRLLAKKHLIFEKDRFDLKRSLSDIAGQDVEHHNNDYGILIKKIRNFFRVEANINLPGPSEIRAQYATFQGWLIEKKIHEGHSEKEALEIPTRERMDEMENWVKLEKPDVFDPAIHT